MHATYSVTKDHNCRINQTSRKNLIHCSGTASRENSVELFVTKTNSGNERNKFCSNPQKIKLTVTARDELVERELTSSERQTIKIGMPQLIIQRDASKTGWRQFVREPPRGELDHIRKGQKISMYWSSLQ